MERESDGCGFSGSLLAGFVCIECKDDVVKAVQVFEVSLDISGGG